MNSDCRTVDAAMLTTLQGWIGKTETFSDSVTAAPVRALSATLDRDDADPVPGTTLPELWHWLYFLPAARQSGLGPDGHPQRGGFLPPVPLPRRMWAGGRLQWQQQPLQVGDAVTRTSRIESVTHKSGRTGDLVFVLVKHAVRSRQGLALTEEHDIVYRANPQPGDPVPAPQLAAKNAAWSREIVPDDVLLFRYSALTFNGHRIHYDRKYVTEVEGYPGLIVHGPLIATLLADLLRRNMPGARLLKFEFRAVRPVFDLWPFKLHGLPSADGKTISLWTEDHEGWLTMQATATLA
ncbi:MaoC family dehydratase N-terminal domain-containing protein [Polaromonas sp.]|uniref:FAS1-like dehydratase domain-containing protein n=1 Tax=Polaromonas sp. TaxID=1869339 RepID=UPI00272FA782|nr:MaoC family dehydratase N-terminal domain-containing protein [Polaromonas sp.]MDP1740812.1 MaoC family dehydratase N-terminal domain-containing protein [Polaromonas sp.]